MKSGKRSSVKKGIQITMLVMVLCAALPIGIVSIVLNYRSTNSVLEKTMTEAAKLAAERIQWEIDLYKALAYETGCTARLANEFLPLETKKEIMQDKVERYGLLEGSIIGADGINTFSGLDSSGKEYFEQAMAGNTYISEPIVSQVDGKLIMMVSAPLWSGGLSGTEVIGVILFIPSEDFLNRIVSSIQISNNSSAYILDAEGTTIADISIENVEAGENIEKEAQTDASLEKLSSLHAKMRGGENSFGAYQKGGVSKLLAFAPIQNTNGWSVAISINSGDFLDGTLSSIYITVLLIAALVLIAVFTAYRIGSKIGRPIKLCAERLTKLAEGDLTAPVPEITSNDENAILAEATRKIVDGMNNVMADTGYMLNEIADGNLTAQSRAAENYNGDFRNMLQAVNQLEESLRATMFHIDEASAQVAGGSNQVADGAQALAQGATEQAASIEELSAALSEINSQTVQNTESCTAARVGSDETAGFVDEASNKMEELNHAMQEIKAASSQIGSIIKTIDNIAFQTNILALNAAVEAARAGEAGKGFAVVAGEVRSLSVKSSDAAKDTTALIEQCMLAVENGSIIAAETAATLGQVVSSSRTVNEMITKVADAGLRQSDYMKQVTLGIDQISSVVQTNSATAQESAAASEQLSGQSQILKDLVARFRLSE